MTRPFAAISSCSAAFCAGYTRSMPVPMTATVRPPAASAAVCAAVSMPAARPLMTGTPRAASPAASSLAWSTPCGCRLPGADDGDRRRVALIGRAAQEEHRRALVDHPEVRRVLAVEDGDHPDPGALPPLEICSQPSRRHLPASTSNSEPWAGACTGSGCPHAAALLQLLGHRGPDDLRVVVARQRGRPAPHASSLPA